MRSTKRDWARLGEYVERRRHELGLDQPDLAARGGPSPATIRKIEGAQQGSYKPATLGALERALNWAPRSVQAILDGQEPTALELLRTTLTDEEGDTYTLKLPDDAKDATPQEREEMFLALEAHSRKLWREIKASRPRE